jgi:hypothetical protein
MIRNDVIKIVIEKLTEIQEISDREKIPISDSTMIDEVLSIGDVGNLCASKDGKRALTVGEIVDRIFEIKSE